MTRRSKILGFCILLLIIFSCGYGIYRWSRPPQEGAIFKYAGVKLRDPTLTYPSPKVTILAPKTDKSQPQGVPFECVFRLVLPANGDFPSWLFVSLKRDGNTHHTALPDPELQSDGTYLCRCTIDGSIRKGKYTLEAECKDTMRPSFFSTAGIVTKTTAIATQALEIK